MDTIEIIEITKTIIVIVVVIYFGFYKNSVKELEIHDSKKDSEFLSKCNIIYHLIIIDKLYDIKIIAKKANSTIEECILKIKYLIKNGYIKEYYVDTNNFLLLKVTQKDLELLNKYEPYIYNSQLQINEISNVISNNNKENIKEIIYNDLLYLSKKNLLNGIVIDEIDRKIIYKPEENKKNNNDYESVKCPNCGALNDVNSYEKVRCQYCRNIIKGSKYEE